MNLSSDEQLQQLPPLYGSKLRGTSDQEYLGYCRACWHVLKDSELSRTLNKSRVKNACRL